MGDRSWADSIHNKRNGVKVRSNKEDWQLEGAVGDGQEESDLMADWATWKETLGDDDRRLVEALEAGDMEAVKAIKSAQTPQAGSGRRVPGISGGLSDGRAGREARPFFVVRRVKSR